MRLTAHEIRVRRRARARALQALYAWDLVPDAGLVQVGERLFTDLAVGPEERQVAAPLLASAAASLEEIDRDLAKVAGSILGDEAMHWAMLRHALGQPPVPVALVS